MCRLDRDHDVYIRRIETYCQIVSEQLHDQSAIFVRVLTKVVQLCNGIIKCLQIYWENAKQSTMLRTKVQTFSRGQACTCLASLQAC